MFRRPGGGPLLVVMLATLALSLVYIQRTSFVVDGERIYTLWDDGMISMRYARNLAEGHGLVWNPGGERVQGYTNLGVTLFLAGLHLLPVSELRVSAGFQLANAVMLLAMLWLVFRLARAVAPDDPVLGPLAALLVAVWAPLPVWSLQGSDVGPVTLLTLAAFTVIAESWRDGTSWPRRAWWLLALGVVVRPDMVLVFGAALAACLWTTWPRWGETLRGGLILGATAGGLGLFSWLYYGDPLPNTFYLKATGAPQRMILAHGFEQLVAMVTPATAVVALVMGWAAVGPLRHNVGFWLCVVTGVGLLAYNVRVGGDWLSDFLSRHIIPGVVLLGVAWLVALRAALARALSEARLRRPWGRALLAGAALLFVFAFHSGDALRDWFVPTDEPMLRDINQLNTRLAFLVRDHTREDATLGVHWAGVPAYFAERTAIDVLGKSDRHIARLETHFFAPGHSKWDWDYVLNERRPDILLRGSRGVSKNPALREDYWSVRTPDGLAFMVRRSSLDVLRDPRRFDYHFYELPARRRVDGVLRR